MHRHSLPLGYCAANFKKSTCHHSRYHDKSELDKKNIYKAPPKKGSCEPPEVEHGDVSGKGDGRSWTGTFSCKHGFALVDLLVTWRKDDNGNGEMSSDIKIFCRLVIQDLNVGRELGAQVLQCVLAELVTAHSFHRSLLSCSLSIFWVPKHVCPRI